MSTIKCQLTSCRRLRPNASISRHYWRVLLPFPLLLPHRVSPKGIYVSDVKIGILRYRNSTWQYTFWQSRMMNITGTISHTSPHPNTHIHCTLIQLYSVSSLATSNWRSSKAHRLHRISSSPLLARNILYFTLTLTLTATLEVLSK